jgi:hypothetical protein
MTTTEPTPLTCPHCSSPSWTIRLTYSAAETADYNTATATRRLHERYEHNRLAQDILCTRCTRTAPDPIVDALLDRIDFDLWEDEPKEQQP